MRSLVNISIDDVSPHPRSSIKVLDRCHELISDYPDIKFTLFVPISYWRTMRPDISTDIITEYLARQIMTNSCQ